MSKFTSMQALKWGFIFLSVNSLVIFLVPVPAQFDPTAELILAPIAGFPVGAALYFFHLFPAEATRYIRYRLAMLRGSQWPNEGTAKTIRTMWLCGVIGSGLLCVTFIDLAYVTFPQTYTAPGSIYSYNGPPASLLLPMFEVAGFVIGVSAFFLFKGLATIFEFSAPKINKAKPVVSSAASNMSSWSANQFANWKNHDYRK
ncbi:hypothetical protein BXY66_1197 [Shimia isoporae]|uniref:Uncharacterized protein n=1 Tax=Shimia isoporae TaxID=647720 RepID=A0A4R1NVN7_9RHOB|nr:hypothetical protein [Shimia isoporae]TCL09152.1 hypothetical protein BXY66_1197 [Shimia isoporae]